MLRNGRVYHTIHDETVTCVWKRKNTTILLPLHFKIQQ